MLYLLDKDAKTVKWNGIPLHEASSAIVKEETNGDLYLTVHYPITDSGVYQLIKEDMLIKAPVPVLGAQLFRIKKPVENDDSLDITAYHITDDVMQRSITPVSVVGQGCAMALSRMVQNAKTGLGDFSFTSDIMDNRTFNTTETETLYSVLLDGKHSIVGTWGGELVRDNFALTIKQSRGADRGVVITTHKNLKSYQRTKNSQNVVTRIHARSTFRAEGAETDTVLAVTVDSPLIGNYPYINEKEYENNDVKTIDELKKWAEAKFANEGIDKVSDAIEIEAYELDGQVVHLGDTVNIKSRKHDVDIYKKAIAYEYNALTEEYISITFDDKPGVGGSGVSSGLSNVADVILSANRNAQEVAIERAVKNANQAFDAEFEKQKIAIEDGIEKAKAEAELYADNIKQSIYADVNAINQSMQAQSEEHDRQVADILSQTQSIETLANQAKSDAASAITRANQVKTDLQNKVDEADAKAVQAQADANALRTDLNQQAQTILAQAQAQTELTNRVTTVETLADGTKTTVAELSKTVDKANGDITSVTNRTKVVEDGLAGVKTNYTQLNQTVNTQTGQIETINSKTADLQSGIDGVTERFNNLQVGGENLVDKTGEPFVMGYGITNTTWNPNTKRTRLTFGTGIERAKSAEILPQGGVFETQNIVIKRNQTYTQAIRVATDATFLGQGNLSYSWFGPEVANSSVNYHRNRKAEIRKIADNEYLVWCTTTWNSSDIKLRPFDLFDLHTALDFRNTGTYIEFYKPKLETGNLPTDWCESNSDFNNQIAEYKRTADQNYAGLQSTVSTLDGKVSTAETKINQLASEVSSKVSQTDYNALTGRVSSAETAITQNATEISKRLTSTQVEQAITSKGYATVTVLENKVKETADSFNRTISETKALIPSDATNNNLWVQSRTTGTFTTETLPSGHVTGQNFCYKIFNNGDIKFNIEPDFSSRLYRTVTFSAWIKYENVVQGPNIWNVFNCFKHNLIRKNSSTGTTSSTEYLTFGGFTGTSDWKYVSYTYDYSANTSYDQLKTPILFNLEWATTGVAWITGVKIELGSKATGYSLAVEDTATVTALHAVNDTVDSHTRTIGAVGTTGSILDNVSNVTQTANGLVTEVSGANGLKTQVSQLAGSYAIQNLTNSGTVLNQLNLNKDGSIKLDGSLVQITGKTYIQDGVITSAKIADLDAGKITTGTLNAARIAVNSIDGSKLVFDQAFVNKMTANEAYLKQLFAQNAFITSVQSADISANMIKGGLLKSSNGVTEFDLNNGNIKFTNISGKIYRQVGANQVQLTTTSWNLSGTASGSFTAINSSELLTATRRVGLEFDLADSSSSIKIFGNNIDIYPDNAAKNYTINTNRTVRLTFDGQDIATVNSLTNDSKGRWNKDSIITTSNNCAIETSDIKLAGHFDSVEKIITDLCKKANITWL